MLWMRALSVMRPVSGISAKRSSNELFRFDSGLPAGDASSNPRVPFPHQPQAGPLQDGDACAGLIIIKAWRGNPMTMRFSVLSGRVRRPREGTVMNIEKYTERSRGFIQSAQSLATREGHQQF